MAELDRDEWFVSWSALTLQTEKYPKREQMVYMLLYQPNLQPNSQNVKTLKVLYINFSFLEIHFQLWEMKLEIFVWQPTLTAAIWIICMTTDIDGYHTDMKFKRKVLYHFLYLKVIPQKTKFNIECLFGVATISPMNFMSRLKVSWS